MKKETLYALVAGIAGFIVIAFGSYWYFSPAAPAKSASAIPAETKGAAPTPVQPAAPGSAFPAPVPSGAAPPLPAPTATPTPTAYGASLSAGSQTVPPSHAAQSPQDDKEKLRSFKARTPSSRQRKYPMSGRERRMRRSAEIDED